MGLFDFLLGKKVKEPATQQSTTPAAKKVLIVEDDNYIRDAYAEILKGEGFDIITAENGLVGLDMVKNNKPDIILLDLMLPIMDGKQMLIEVRKLPECNTLPVIVLTNAGTVENEKETKFYNNADAFFIKSNITPGDVVSKVRELVSDKNF